MPVIKLVATPMVSTTRLTKIGSPTFLDCALYRSVVSAIQYVTITRPRLSCAVDEVG